MCSKQSFQSFYEDYLNCLSEYKDDFWIESILEMSDNCISAERAILSKIRAIKEMLIFLKIKWIKEFLGESKQQFFICKESCLEWLINPRYAIKAFVDFVL